VSGGGTFCGSAALTVTGGSGGIIYYQGTTSNGTSITIPSTSQVVSTTGTYYFRARSTAGVWGSQGSVSVTINPISIAPTLISGTTNVCSGISTTLTATGGTGTGYQWYAGGCGSGSILSTTSSLTISPTSNTTYFVRTTSSCGASSCISKLVTVTTLPVVTVTPATNCGSGNVTLSATPSEGTINWYSSATGAPIGSGNTYTTYLSTTTTFYVDVTGATCALSARIPVTGTINPLPSVVNVTSGIYGDCGQGYQLIATGGFGGTIYYQGTTYNGTSTATTSSPIITASGTYYFRSRSSYGCWGPQGSVNVTYNPPVVVYNQTSFSNLDGWTREGGWTSWGTDNVTFVNGGVTSISFWTAPPVYFYRNDYVTDNLMIESVISPGQSNHKAAVLFDTLNSTSTYSALMSDYYYDSGFYLNYSSTQLGYAQYPTIGNAWSIPNNTRFNIKIFKNGAIKKAKYWEVGTSEPVNWNFNILDSHRLNGGWGGTVNMLGKFYSIKVTDCS
jgi:hypothetical protein